MKNRRRSSSLLVSVLVTMMLSPASFEARDDSSVSRAGFDVISFTDGVSAPFGTFGGVPFVRYTGFVEGTTSLGEFRVPYEIVAPQLPALGNGTVLVEPPHFAVGPVGRDAVLTRQLLFGNGFSYAAVGFGTNGLNILNPRAEGLILAGDPVTQPGALNPSGIVDEEILVQFARALTSHPVPTSILGAVERRYAYGLSQTASVLLETLHSPAREGLFDLTLLHIALWKPPFQRPGVFDNLPDEFQPLRGVGRVLFIESEGDQIVSKSEQFRRAAAEADYRVYEVAGAAHAPTPRNPLDHFMVARALFSAGDRWVRSGFAPPPSTLIEDDPSAGVDPVYSELGLVTGIERDADGNAVGGVRLPDLALGRALFIAADFSFQIIPGAFGLVGAKIDLACEPAPGAATNEPRFPNHGAYVLRFVQQVNELRAEGFLLADDAEALKEQAALAAVGKPGSCGA